ncbi:MAG: hypothetical protein U9R73_07775 [Pseudomonadota bacterium]|jgi:hypothetical protein|nr:hypothetical protein [Pseudomonadota bacterium]
MERGRVIEIIEAYGGYPAAWPEDERAAAERLTLSDAALTALMNDAREVDRLLRDWACELVPTTDAEADAAADRALAEACRSGAPRRMWMRAAFGGAIAASLAIGAVLLSRPDAVPTPATSPQPTVQVALGELPGEDAQAAHDMLVWGNVFTPTPEEEMVL